LKGGSLLVFVHRHTSYGDAWLLVTGGGHVDFSSGLETVINAGKIRGKRILASSDGWKGSSLTPHAIYDITDYPVQNLQFSGGSFIGSDRFNPEKSNLLDDLVSNICSFGNVVIISFGGDDTQKIAEILFKKYGLPVVGWPKTMDNDTQGSYATIGYRTAVRRASREVRTAFDTAYTNSKVVLVVMFGRDSDWVDGGAADFGFADYTIPAEKKGLTFTAVAAGIKEKLLENKDKYGRSFAVVAVSEAGDQLAGLEPFVQRYTSNTRMDNFDHVKLNPERLALALQDALREYSGIESTAPKVLTYHLRDGKLQGIDRDFARMTAEECVRLIDREEFGRVATIQHPDMASSWPEDPSAWVKAEDGSRLFVSSVPLSIAAKKRYVTGTGFFDYDQLRPTERMTAYLKPLLGPKPIDPRDKIISFRLAVPVGLDLRVDRAHSKMHQRSV